MLEARESRPQQKCQKAREGAKRSLENHKNPQVGRASQSEIARAAVNLGAIIIVALGLDMLGAPG
jgi:hypothetical protein